MAWKANCVNVGCSDPFPLVMQHKHAHSLTHTHTHTHTRSHTHSHAYMLTHTYVWKHMCTHMLTRASLPPTLFQAPQACCCSPATAGRPLEPPQQQQQQQQRRNPCSPGRPCSSRTSATLGTASTRPQAEAPLHGCRYPRTSASCRHSRRSRSRGRSSRTEYPRRREGLRQGARC